MMTESMNEKTRELAYFKIRHISSEIDKILEEWGYSNIEDFLQDTRNGKNDEEAIDDSIELQNLHDTLSDLEKLVEMTD